MAKQILGKVAYISKGEYSTSKKYEINDVVSYQGSSYVSLKDTQGNLPTDENFWMLLAAKGEQGIQGEKGEIGDPGPQGEQGIQGEKGDTYVLTDEDKNTIKNEITENANSIFNQNVNAKTDAFNSNANTKTQAFNENVENQTNAFSETVNNALSSFESETSQYAKFTDYANSDRGGTVKTGYFFGVGEDGVTKCSSTSYSSYLNCGNGIFISKGTLENIILGKKLISETNYANNERGGVIKINTNYGLYMNNGFLAATGISISDYDKANGGLVISKNTLDNILIEKIGSIDSILDTINGEVV